MNAITYTPTRTQASGFAYANSKCRDEHDRAQRSKPEAERISYAVTDEQFALSAVARVGDSYFDQKLETIGEDNWEFVKDVAELKESNVKVATKYAELQAAVAEAQA